MGQLYLYFAFMQSDKIEVLLKDTNYYYVIKFISFTYRVKYILLLKITNIYSVMFMHV